MQPVLECKSIYKGFPYVVLFMPGCYRCGYVGVQKSNPLYGKSVDDLEFIECHGGINYSESSLCGCHGGITYSKPNLCGCEESDMWWIGFDCIHYFDGYDIETAEQYFGNSTEWKEIFGSGIMREYHILQNSGYKIADLGYVKNECKKIIDQIVGQRNEVINFDIA